METRVLDIKIKDGVTVRAGSLGSWRMARKGDNVEEVRDQSMRRIHYVYAK